VTDPETRGYLRRVLTNRLLYSLEP
jgi:hypothetical protein